MCSKNFIPNAKIDIIFVKIIFYGALVLFSLILVIMLYCFLKRSIVNLNYIEKFLIETLK